MTGQYETHTPANLIQLPVQSEWLRKSLSKFLDGEAVQVSLCNIGNTPLAHYTVTCANWTVQAILCNIIASVYGALHTTQLSMQNKLYRSYYAILLLVYMVPIWTISVRWASVDWWTRVLWSGGRNNQIVVSPLPDYSNSNNSRPESIREATPYLHPIKSKTEIYWNIYKITLKFNAVIIKEFIYVENHCL